MSVKVFSPKKNGEKMAKIWRFLLKILLDFAQI
jgi:hypothetical protein